MRGNYYRLIRLCVPPMIRIQCIRDAELKRCPRLTSSYQVVKFPAWPVQAPKSKHSGGVLQDSQLSPALRILR